MPKCAGLWRKSKPVINEMCLLLISQVVFLMYFPNRSRGQLDVNFSQLFLSRYQISEKILQLIGKLIGHLFFICTNTDQSPRWRKGAFQSLINNSQDTPEFTGCTKILLFDINDTVPTSLSRTGFGDRKTVYHQLKSDLGQTSSNDFTSQR